MRDQGVEVGHFVVLPDEGASVAVSIDRLTYDLALLVDAVGEAVQIPRKRAEVFEAAVFGPKDGVAGGRA